MPSNYTSSDIRPGDCILYKAKGIFGTIIAIKTWHNVGHVEVYIGNKISFASRNGLGVAYYDANYENIAAVLRPNRPFDILKAMEWSKKVLGQKYDWLGLLRFAWRSEYKGISNEDKQFCSEVATRFYRSGGLSVFRNEDADSIAPFQFALESNFDLVIPTTDLV